MKDKGQNIILSRICSYLHPIHYRFRNNDLRVSDEHNKLECHSINSDIRGVEMLPS